MYKIYVYIYTRTCGYMHMCSGSPYVNQCQLYCHQPYNPSAALWAGCKVLLGPPAHLREANCSSWVYEQTRRMAGHWSNEIHPTLEVDVSKKKPVVNLDLCAFQKTILQAENLLYSLISLISSKRNWSELCTHVRTLLSFTWMCIPVSKWVW